jgi:hypothetical protein
MGRAGGSPALPAAQFGKGRGAPTNRSPPRRLQWQCRFGGRVPLQAHDSHARRVAVVEPPIQAVATSYDERGQDALTCAGCLQRTRRTEWSSIRRDSSTAWRRRSVPWPRPVTLPKVPSCRVAFLPRRSARAPVSDRRRGAFLLEQRWRGHLSCRRRGGFGPLRLFYRGCVACFYERRGHVPTVFEFDVRDVPPEGGRVSLGS